MTQSRKARRRQECVRRVAFPVIIAVLFIAGVGVLLYPTAAAWINQAQQSAIIDGYARRVDDVEPAALRQEVLAARDYNQSLSGGALVAANRNVPDAQNPVQGGGYDELLDANGTGLMARLKIPSIAVDLPIFHGTSDETLREGVGHLEGTALPVGGSGTHAVLTGHRGLADAELFTHLDRVSVGDTFSIEVFGEVLAYRVRETRIVDPADTETLFPQGGQDLVTLVTCTPLGINTQRILVTGERVAPTPEEIVRDAGHSPEVPGFAWWAVILGGTVLLATAYAWLMSRPRPARPNVHPDDATSARSVQTLQAAAGGDTVP